MATGNRSLQVWGAPSIGPGDVGERLAYRVGQLGG
jgi:hypothetical protein